MAIMGTACKFAVKKLLIPPALRCSTNCVNAYCTQVAHQKRNPMEYPPVKPKYPPGSWGKLSPKLAWRMYENSCLPLNDIPNVKERLEQESGSKELPHWNVFALDNAPGKLNYKQHITKTHVLSGLPDIYMNELPNDIDELCETLKPTLCDVICQEVSHMKHLSSLDPEKHQHYRAHALVGQIVNTIYTHLGLHCNHLLTSQFDENVRLETYWYKGGYGKVEDEVNLTRDLHKEMPRFQLKHNTSYQIRTEQPLPEFLALDSAECSGNYPKFNYRPVCAGQYFTIERPITVSGHWIGDPCEFGLVSFHVLDEAFTKMVESYGRQQAEAETLSYGLVASFGSTLAQAYNQGFNTYFDLTYPFTTQTVVTDGQRFRFCSYQLNTARLWATDEQNPLRNLLWTTDMMSLYDVVEGREVKGFNEDVLRHLIQYALLKPRDRGVDMRPHLPLEEAPVNKEKYINHVGEEVIEEPKIGRWQYPRNAVYF